MQRKYSSFFNTTAAAVTIAVLAYAHFSAYGQTTSPDFRLGIRVYGGACGANPDKAAEEIGIPQFTPWANDGGGQSPAAFNPKLAELHCEQVKLEARTPALPAGKDIRFGVQLSQGKDCSKALGVIQYTPWASGGGGYSEWAKDGGSVSPGFDDPQCARLIVETRDTDTKFSIKDIRLGAQAGNGYGRQYCTRVPVPYAEVTTPWASEVLNGTSGWSGMTGAGGVNPECLRVKLEATTPMNAPPHTPTPAFRVFPPTWRFAAGDTKQLEARYYPDTTADPSVYQDVTAESAWRSENSATVSVSIGGRIRGEQEGTTSVHAEYQGLDATSVIEVYKITEPTQNRFLQKFLEILPRL